MTRKTSRPAPDATTPASVGDRILATASDLFYREGVRATGIQRVIDEAGIAKASLYAHYDSKDALVAACLAQRSGTARARVEEALADPALDARGRLLRFFDLEDEWISSPDFRGCPFLNAASEIADDSHPARAVSATQRQWLHNLIAMLVREIGVAHPEAVTKAIIVLHDGASSAALLDGNRDAAKEARWAVEQLLVSPTPRRATATRRRR